MGQPIYFQSYWPRDLLLGVRHCVGHRGDARVTGPGAAVLGLRALGEREEHQPCGVCGARWVLEEPRLDVT